MLSERTRRLLRRLKDGFDLLSRSSKDKRIVVEGAGHVIQEERPDAVVAAIRELTSASRQVSLANQGTTRNAVSVRF